MADEKYDLVEKIKSWWVNSPEDVSHHKSENSTQIISHTSVGGGLIGLAICPGGEGGSISGTVGESDLDTYLNDIESWGASMVVSLLSDAELDALEREAFGEKIRAREMDWVRLPFPTAVLPDSRTLEAFGHVSPEIHRALDSKQNVLIHGMNGSSKSGLIAAMLLTERGDTVAGAVSRLRDIRPGVLESPEQEAFIYRDAELEGPYAGKILASLFGGAIGDALGAEIEFMQLAEIRAKFPNQVDRILPHDGKIGSITDDTQMTLFTAEGLIRAHDNGTDPVAEVHHALLRWLVTQGETPKGGVDISGLARDLRLHNQRAPGMTCTSALRYPTGLGQPADNNSKGCGTIMRVAPVALMGGDDMYDIAQQTSALTHGNVTGQKAAGAWAKILSAVLQGEDLETVAAAQMGPSGIETSTAIMAAIEAKRDGTPETVESLGGGWVAEEALSIALYSALAATTFEQGLQIAVTHSGDSDSTGAIAGNLLGLMYPDQVMEHPWRHQIECPDLIKRAAKDIERCRTLGASL